MFTALVEVVDQLRLGRPDLKTRKSHVMHIIYAIMNISKTTMFLKNTLVRDGRGRRFDFWVPVDPFTFMSYNELREEGGRRQSSFPQGSARPWHSGQDLLRWRR